MTTIEHDGPGQFFFADVEGNRARLDTVAENRMTVTHTRVPPPIEGRGIAAELMRSALTFARVKNWELVPACSYAAAYLQRQSVQRAKQHAEDLVDESLEESFPASDSPSVGRAD